MAKVKSREEKRLDGYRQYLKNKEAVEKLEKVFDKNMSKLIERSIKKVTPEFDKEVIEYVLGFLKDKPTGSRTIQIVDGFKQYKIPISKKQNKELLNGIETKADRYNRIINQLKDEMSQIYCEQDKEKCLSSLCLKNFKGFSDKNEEKDNTIKIKPITLIYGPNSYGKSSIMQSLLLLYQTITEEFDFRSVTLKLNGNFVNLGSFNDFVNKNAKEKEFRIELSLPYKMPDSDSNIITETIIGYNFAIKKSPSTENEQIVLSKVDISRKEKDINSAIKSSPWRIPIYEFIQSKEDRNMYDKYEYGQKKDVTVKSSFLTLGSINESQDVEDVIKNILYISSFRNPPSRYYLPDYSVKQYVGKNGESTREILRSDSEVRKKVSYWLKKITGYTLSEEKNKDKNVTSINLDDGTTEIKNINLMDLGSGVTQVLPIITQAFITSEKKVKLKNFKAGRNYACDDIRYREGSMVLIEEPEIHLHPRAQAELGSMFADAIKVTNNTFIIETHSENLLLRLEKLIRRGELSKDDISVIYVHKDKEGSHCIPLELDDEGDIVNIREIPGGFFEEGYNELFGG